MNNLSSLSLMFLLSIMGCGLFEPEVDKVEFVVEPRLDIDDNGYYHLELSRTTLQTIHRLSGHIYLNDEPYENVKFSGLRLTFGPSMTH